MRKSKCLFIQQILVEYLLYVPGPILGSGVIATNQSVSAMFILEPVSKSIVLLDIEMKKAKEGKGSEQGGMWGHGCFRCIARWAL